MFDLRTCVSPEGRFVFGLHQPRFTTVNLRIGDDLSVLGHTEEGRPQFNTANFPASDVEEPAADAIYEIANPFPFKGTTYIGKGWADRAAADLGRIAIPARPDSSLTQYLRESPVGGQLTRQETARFVAHLPRPLQLAVAVTSTDPADLTALAEVCCGLEKDPVTGVPIGMRYTNGTGGHARVRIFDEQLFDAVANNSALPESYRQVMVLRPGAQGNSEIVGEWRRDGSHVFEYLRRNSYIPWGHFAANMADDAVRYAVGRLNPEDIFGMRHLYYQRTCVRLAAMLELPIQASRRALTAVELEELRRTVKERLAAADPGRLPFTATLWGWNFGFDYAPSGYRLHASHQQIHQQYALIPATVPAAAGSTGDRLDAFACGDMIRAFIGEFQRQSGRGFFECYLEAIATNRRMDERTDRPRDLVVYQDDQVLLVVPKAQTSQWELQLMTRRPVGHIVEADAAVRRALDRALLVAMRVLTALGATMITVIEYGKRFDAGDNGQHLLYAFLPRLPESPGAFSEAQLRWINGHYPEDFAEACRRHLSQATADL